MLLQGGETGPQKRHHVKLSQAKMDWLCVCVYMLLPSSMCVTKASEVDTLTDINDAPSPSLTPLTIKRRPE